MALYWVAGTGNSNDSTNHWATSSGGAPNVANVPDATLDCIWDANSFTGASQVFTVNANFTCKSMDWWDATNTPQFKHLNSSYVINVHGTVRFGTMTFSDNGVAGMINLVATTTGHIISSLSVIACDITINGAGGGYTLASNLTISGGSVYHGFEIVQGTFDTDGYDPFTSYQFNVSGTLARAVYLRDSIVTCPFRGISIASATNLTWDAGTSLIKFSPWYGGAYYQCDLYVPDGVKLYDVEFDGKDGDVNTPDFIYIATNLTCNTITFVPYNTAVASYLKICTNDGKTVTADTWVGDGLATQIVKLYTDSAGNHCHFVKPSGTFTGNYFSIKDNYASGGNWIAVNSTDEGGNSGWVFEDWDYSPFPNGNGILIQEFFKTVTAAAGTSTTVINSTAHGILAYDMIVNTTRRSVINGGEPGSRMCASKTANTITLSTAIAGQTNGDSVNLFHHVDRTPWLKAKSLKVSTRSDHLNSANMTFQCTVGEWYPRKGQEIRIFVNYRLVFGGVISEITKQRPGVGVSSSAKLFVNVSCNGFGAVPGRRTVAVEYNDTTCGAIVTDMIDDVLNQEGITAGTVDTGAEVPEYPEDPEAPLSVLRLLDDMASMSGFKWYITDYKKLHFIKEDTIVVGDHDITDAGSFTDYRDVSVKDSILNYRNKEFVIGGWTDTGNYVYIISADDNEIIAQQLIDGTSGVYGKIDQNEYITGETTVTAEAGTNTTIIVSTTHGLSDGDVIYNETRDAQRQILVTDVNTINVQTAITGQTTGDTVTWWPDANKLMHELLAVNVDPVEMTFSTFTNDFAPSTKIIVDLAAFELSNATFMVESVDYSDELGTGLTTGIKSTVTMAQRDTAAWSTKHLDGGNAILKKLSMKPSELKVIGTY